MTQALLHRVHHGIYSEADGWAWSDGRRRSIIDFHSAPPLPYTPSVPSFLLRCCLQFVDEHNCCLQSSVTQYSHVQLFFHRAISPHCGTIALHPPTGKLTFKCLLFCCSVYLLLSVVFRRSLSSFYQFSCLRIRVYRPIFILFPKYSIRF